MKIRTRRILIILSPVLIILIVIVVLLFRYKDVVTSMSPADTQAINDTVFCIKDSYVNAYLFKTKEGYLMFDAGNNESRMLDEMANLGIDPLEITMLLLTHSDGDHIDAIGSLDNAEIYMHREEKQMVDGTTERLGSIRDWKFGDFKLFDSDQVLEIGNLSIKVVYTPGHTPGSCCFIINNKYFVTGDNLFVTDGKYTPFIEEYTMNPKLNSESISKLPPPEDFEYILTGHGGIWRK